MKQVALIPSGCSVASLMQFTTKYFFYASSLTVYAINNETFCIEKILPASQQRIVSFSVNPHDSNILSSVDSEGMLMLWNVEEEICLQKISVKVAQSYILLWDPFAKFATIVFCCPAISCCSWDTTQPANSALSEFFAIKSNALVVTAARWNPHTAGLLAIGCTNGAVYLVNKCLKKNYSLVLPKDASGNVENTKVVDVQWDRLSSIYILVAYTNFIALWDTESATQVQVFDRVSNNSSVTITAISWMDWTAGNFVSSTSKSGTLSVWNASQKNPIDTVKVTTGGINSILFGNNNKASSVVPTSMSMLSSDRISDLMKRVHCCCSDGSVSIFNMQKNMSVHSFPAGHNETIFDCKSSSLSPEVLASASYDGTVKLWSMIDQSLIGTLEGAGGVVYSVDWSPTENIIAASTIQGHVLMWDVSTGALIARFSHHVKPSYFVSWCARNPNLVGSSSLDHSLVIFEVDTARYLEDAMSVAVTSSKSRKPANQFNKADGAVTETVVKFRYLHNAAVYAFCFHPFDRRYIASACHDGSVRVFNIDTKAMLYSLACHTARVFSVVWSPLVSGLLASGSDDRSVCIWKVDLDSLDADDGNQAALQSGIKPQAVLLGHSSNVRALCWSLEHRHILLSGAWDSSIRVWDVFHNTCLQIVRDHVADVYAITSHPKRPFSFISSSRDTTIRQWELEGSTMRMRMAAVWTGCFDVIVGETEEGEYNPQNMSMSSFFGSSRMQLDRVNTSYPLDPVDNVSRLLLPCQLHGKESSRLSGVLLNMLGRAAVNYLPYSTFRPPEVDCSLDQQKGKHESHVVQPTGERVPFDSMTLACVYYTIFNYFSGANGSSELWEAVISNLKSEKVANGERVVASNNMGSISVKSTVVGKKIQRGMLHESDLLGQAKSTARQAEASKLATKSHILLSHSSKITETLWEAALMYVRAGDFAKYCVIMIELNDWPAALAMAPAVSFDYWQSLMKKYAQIVAASDSEKCIPYLVGCGQDGDAVNFYVKRDDINNALLIAKMSESRSDLIPELAITPTSNGNRSSPVSFPSVRTDMLDQESGHSSRAKTETESEESRGLIRSVADSASLKLCQRSQPFLAAAQYVMISDVSSAVSLLLACGAVDCAYALANVFDMLTDSLLIEFADAFASFGDISIALHVLGQLKNAEEVGPSQSLLVSKYCVNEKHALHWATTFSLTSFADWATKGEEEDLIGSDASAVQSLVAARQFTRAVSCGLKFLSRLIRTPIGATATAKKVLRYLKHVYASELEATALLMHQRYIFWFAAHEAAELGYWEIGWCMLRLLKNSVIGEPATGFITHFEIECQELCFRIAGGDPNVMLMIHSTMSSLPENSPPAVLPALQSLNQVISQLFTSPPDASKAQQAKGKKTQGPPEVWSTQTNNIFSYLQLLSDSWSLPSLQLLLYPVNATSRARPVASVVQGSVIPICNQKQKANYSHITGHQIQGGVPVMLDDLRSVISCNEALIWRKVNPYSPLMSGKLIPVSVSE